MKSLAKAFARGAVIAAIWVAGSAQFPVTAMTATAATVAAASNDSGQVEPNAGKWDTWVLKSSNELRPKAPPNASETATELTQLKSLIAASDPKAQSQVTYWDAGSPSYRWIELAFERYGKGPPGPPVSRALALLNVAIYDAIVATWDAKYHFNRPRPSGIVPRIATPASPSYPSEHAATAGAASAVLAYLFPEEKEFFTAKAEEAAQSRLHAGVHYPSDVAAGLVLGKSVGAKVIEWAKADGSDAKWTGKIPVGPDKWIGENPVAPLSGNWKTWVIASPGDYLPPPPPAHDSEQTKAELQEIKAVTRTFPIASRAMIWHTFDRAYPYWDRYISTSLFEQRQDSNLPKAALMYAAMAVAQHDAIVACFNAKYTYWRIRPPQLDKAITPLFPSPNHPSYPAAHACASTAAATVLAAYFPDGAEMLRAAAEEAGDSRIWAGVHYASDRDAGEILGKAVGEAVLKRVGQMTKP
jgi:membrane-associated phospholipid phosphatase